MRCRIVRRFAQTALVLLASAPFARADDNSPIRPADPAAVSPELREVLQDFVNYDPLRSTSKHVTPLRVSPPTRNADWSRSDKSDGSASVTVKKALPLSVDTNVGADIGLAATPMQTYQPDKTQQSAKDVGSGAAWANMQVVPGFASLDARLDPTREQGRFGTTLSRSVPLGPNYSVTVQSSYALIDTLASAQSSSLPLGQSAALPPSQFWTNDRLVKFNILSTGTSLAAGTTTSSIDNITHNKFLAEQKLFENFNVTTSVIDFGGPAPNKSVTAGFKLSW